MSSMLPSTSRSPMETAMIATDSDASTSSTREDRNEIRSTFIVLARYWSPTALMRRHLGLGPVEDLQCGQARHDVQEVPGQDPQGRPLPVHPGLGEPADQDHEHRDDRHRQGDDHRGQRVLGQDEAGGDERNRRPPGRAAAGTGRSRCRGLWSLASRGWSARRPRALRGTPGRGAGRAPPPASAAATWRSLPSGARRPRTPMPEPRGPGSPAPAPRAPCGPRELPAPRRPGTPLSPPTR